MALSVQAIPSFLNIENEIILAVAFQDFAGFDFGDDLPAQKDTFGFGAQGGFGADLRISTATPVPTTYAPMHKALAVKDVAYLRSWRPPV